MVIDLKNLIEDVYDIHIKHIEVGPRQFVAETFILDIEHAVKYFVKVINYDKYAQRTLDSLPVLEQLIQQGISNINYPIKTKAGELYILHDKKLIILFNYIDAVQTFEYDNKNFGELIAQIHSKTSKILTSIPEEDFSLLYSEDFESSFEKSLNPTKKDRYIIEMSSIMKKYEKEIRQDWRDFQKNISKCKNRSFDFVITHGDAPGNILKDVDQNIFLIDWDAILLAPAERDTWFMKDNQDFLDAYLTIYPNYKFDELSYKFYLYNRFFEDLLGFIEEIMSDSSDDHKELNLNNLKKDCLEEWLRPLIRSLNG